MTLGEGMRIAVGGIVVIVSSFILFTWWALEWDGVAILETRTADGGVRSTHVWYAEPDGELWVEAGTPQNGWYVDVQKDAMVSFRTSERSGDYIAEPIAGEDAHRRIRRLLREKYGLRDWWIDVLFDTSHSIAVRMVSPSSDP
jgi:hypothetical protein